MRWQTYNLMRTLVGDESLSKAGIYKPQDLLPFTWEARAEVPTLSEDDIMAMQAEIEAINAANNKSDE